MNNNLYGGRTYPDAPLMFDKIYPNYKAAIGDIQQGAVFIGRYIIIMYCDTTLSNDLCSALETIEYNEDTLESDVIAVLGDSPPVWKISSAKNYVKNYNVDISGVNTDNLRSYDRVVFKVGYETLYDENGNKHQGYKLIETTDLHTMSVFADTPYTIEEETYNYGNSKRYRTMVETVPSVAFVQNVADGTLRTVANMLKDLFSRDPSSTTFTSAGGLKIYQTLTNEFTSSISLNLFAGYKIKIIYDFEKEPENNNTFDLYLGINNSETLLLTSNNNNVAFGEIEIVKLYQHACIKYTTFTESGEVNSWNESLNYWTQESDINILTFMTSLEEDENSPKIRGLIKVEEYCDEIPETEETDNGLDDDVN